MLRDYYDPVASHDQRRHDRALVVADLKFNYYLTGADLYDPELQKLMEAVKVEWFFRYAAGYVDDEVLINIYEHVHYMCRFSLKCKPPCRQWRNGILARVKETKGWGAKFVYKHPWASSFVGLLSRKDEEDTDSTVIEMSCRPEPSEIWT
ncbi:hypothetical protein FA15DRAFT_668282 [Coprinopsis marcescibilis]|uniref:Uncharacterized protein n=1 Tax=Coprinopsis marcescibilis TaxID=230819 RepID=A0A5C3KZ57_COPMA|nr:hypothetical protein FA15DRAFT_668282 [Coprinopsis marcescibilis]